VNTTAQMAKQLKEKIGALDQIRPSYTLLLLSDDEGLAKLVLEIVKRPWRVVRHRANRYLSHKTFALLNVRLVILDDQAVEENDRCWLLAQIRKHFSNAACLYVAGTHSENNERRSRTNGAHYYFSKPLAHERFEYVLQSFLEALRAKG
jgi:response regulator of citrate/malate metabolism